MANSVTVDGRRISYSILGDGPNLLVVNGFAATSSDWDPVFLEHLAASNRLVLVDYRGMGESEDDGSPFSIRDLARDVAAVIHDAADGKATAVLGWSMGGFVAQTLCSVQPELVSRLILLSTDSGGRGAEYSDMDVLRSIADVTAAPLAQAQQLLALLFPGEVADELFEQFGQLVADARSQLDGNVLQRQLAAIQAWRVEGSPGATSEIEVPTLIATGTYDAVIPASNSDRLAALIDASWLLRFKGGGHAFMAQYPAALAGVINRFLEV